MRFDVITIFPDAVTSYLQTSLLGKAQKQGFIEVRVTDLRDFTSDVHRTVDDTPYGGGPGMVLKAEPIYRAVTQLRKDSDSKKIRVILFSTRGQTFDRVMTRRLCTYDHLILICGRYEGVDERIATHLADEEISIGAYVLSGGELPALVVVEAVSRHVPGVLGKVESLEEIKGSYPVYTKPDAFVTDDGKTWEVPEVLRSGDHKKIDAWRKQYSL